MEGVIGRVATRRLRPLRCVTLPNPPRRAASNSINLANKRLEQANPLGGYYEDLLSQPLPQVTSATRQPTTPSPPTSLPKTQKEENLAKARIVFGSRIAGPAERKADIQKKSTLVAGVWVPPRPEEPDNCCMSGCVNCVWDLYRDDMEAWAAARRQAGENLRKESGLERGRKKRHTPQGTGLMLGEGEKGAQHTMVSMDDDGGGSEANWSTGLESDLFKDIPVGIREFMKTEKMLRDKHLREHTSAG